MSDIYASHVDEGLHLTSSSPNSVMETCRKRNGMTIVHIGFESGNNNENGGTIERTIDDS